MVTSISSGLGATCGVAQETVVGTFTTTGMRWPRFTNETFAMTKTHVESAGLHQGLSHESKRRAFVQREAPGTISMDLAYREMGIYFKNMLGSSATATQVGGTAAYLQVHTPGDTKGLGLSFQVGRPQTTGTIQQFNYNGAKVLDWTIGVQRGQIAQLDLTLDAWNEDTSAAYAAASFVSNAYVADFHQCVIKLGGTASTVAGVTSITGNAPAVGIIANASIKGTNSMKTDRFNIGSQTKQEQLVNNFRTFEVDFELDFANLTDVYNAFAADTPLCFQQTFTGPVAGSPNNYFVDIVIPALSINECPVPVDNGPDVLNQKVKGVALDDGVNNVIQISYQSTDTTV